MSKDFDFETPAQATAQRIDFKAIFFNPEKGLNLIRIASLKKGQSFRSHFCKTKTGEKKFVKCPGAGCPLCIDGTNKPSTRYFVKIIDRKTNALKVWEFGSQIKTQIQEFVNDIRTKVANKETDENDSLTDYNIEIRRREPGTNPLYSISIRERVTTDPRMAATVANDDKIMADDKINLEELAKPWSIDRIKSQILGIEVPGQGSASAAPAAAAPQVTPKVSYPSAGTATVAKPDVQALTAQAGKLGAEDDSWLND